LRNHKVTWWVPRACPPGTSPRNAPGGPPPRFPTPLRSGGAICMDIYLSLHGPCCQWCSPLHSRIYISCSRGRLRPRTNWPICPPMPINAHRAPGRTSPAPPPPSAPSQPANQPAIAPRPPNHARQYTPGHRAGVRTPSGPRASRAPPPLNCPPARPPERPTPPPRQLAPHAPPPWGTKHRRRPPRPGIGGLRTACGAWWRGQRGAGGSCREGHPARAPTVRSPAARALTQHNAATVTDPQSLIPGPLGPGRFYTNSPTPFGV
jgi:hypothetical protein